MEDAVQTVMQQCELWADNIVPTSHEYSSVEEKVLEAAEEDV